MAKNLQELVESATPTSISIQDVLNLCADLNHHLRQALTGWDRPGDHLRITKDRIKRSQACNAQLLGGGPVPINEHLALGRVVDVAAPTIATAPDTPHRYGNDGQSLPGAWGAAIAEPLRIEDLDLREWYEALSVESRKEHDEAVEIRCEELKRAIGDLSSFTVVSQNWTIVDLAADVVLSGKPDLVVLGAERVIVEVKSGKGFGIDDELAFYSLIDTLSQGTAPSAIVGVSLLPSPKITSHAVDLDILQRAADRVVQTARRCRAVDESIAKNRWPLTSSGRHCVICDLAERCPDIPDELLEEARAMNSNELDDDDFEYIEEEA